mmetsp:Transcript_3679/g.11598  ORF Transcript_3679/g.11598 Transcript_3679/m.11598 type:complete len:285 (-) Transcript_3679:1857-2711(-)
MTGPAERWVRTVLAAGAPVRCVGHGARRRDSGRVERAAVVVVRQLRDGAREHLRAPRERAALAQVVARAKRVDGGLGDGGLLLLQLPQHEHHALRHGPGRRRGEGAGHGRGRRARRDAEAGAVREPGLVRRPRKCLKLAAGEVVRQQRVRGDGLRDAFQLQRARRMDGDAVVAERRFEVGIALQGLERLLRHEDLPALRGALDAGGHVHVVAVVVVALVRQVELGLHLDAQVDPHPHVEPAEPGVLLGGASLHEHWGPHAVLVQRRGVARTVVEALSRGKCGVH